MFFEKKLNCRSKDDMAKFLVGHKRYSTMNTWNNCSSYSNLAKIHSLGLSAAEVEKAYQIISVDDYMDEFNWVIDDFRRQYNGAYTIGFNGRSAGHMVLYSGEYYQSEYKSYCPKCGQRNYQVATAGNSPCGVCKTQRVNYERPLTYHRVHSRGIDDDMRFEDFMDLSMGALKSKVDLVMEFDRACDRIRSAFIEVLRDYMIVEETVMVPQKVRRIEPIAI